MYSNHAIHISDPHRNERNQSLYSSSHQHCIFTCVFVLIFIFFLQMFLFLFFNKPLRRILLRCRKGCHRCVVIYQKHLNTLQYKESECEDMYIGQLNPAPMPIHSVLKSDHSRGAHPNMNGHSRLSSSDQYSSRSNEDSDNCKQRFFYFFILL